MDFRLDKGEKLDLEKVTKTNKILPHSSPIKSVV